MLSVINVMKRDHPLTEYEESLFDSVVGVGIMAVCCVLYSIIAAVEFGISEVVSTFTTLNGLSIVLMIILLALFIQFLYGANYLIKLNRAQRLGESLQDVIVSFKSVTKKLLIKQKQFTVRIEDGNTAVSPIFSTDKEYQFCTVYKCKDKYYFTDLS